MKNVDEMHPIARKLQLNLENYYDDGRMDPIILTINDEEVQVFRDECRRSTQDDVVVRTLPKNYDWDENGHPEDELFTDLHFAPDDSQLQKILAGVIDQCGFDIEKINEEEEE